MIKVETQVKLPFLWGKTVFKKANWTQVNLIVGPNGSGKTVLAQEVARQFEKAGYKITYLQADRADKEDFYNLDFEHYIVNNETLEDLQDIIFLILHLLEQWG